MFGFAEVMVGSAWIVERAGKSRRRRPAGQLEDHSDVFGDLRPKRKGRFSRHRIGHSEQHIHSAGPIEVGGRELFDDSTHEGWFLVPR